MDYNTNHKNSVNSMGMDYKIEHFEKFNDQRGELVVFLRNRSLKRKYKEFGQIYFVTFNKKGVIRANHYHRQMREWFGVIKGKVRVALVDIKTKESKNFTLDGNSKKYVRLEIGPGVVHGFKSISDEVSLLNYTNKEWLAKDVFSMEVIK
ncbi:MAG: WxcM-like domain-containing protein [Patescibacteria group bacterium]